MSPNSLRTRIPQSQMFTSGSVPPETIIVINFSRHPLRTCEIVNLKFASWDHDNTESFSIQLVTMLVMMDLWLCQLKLCDLYCPHLHAGQSHDQLHLHNCIHMAG